MYDLTLKIGPVDHVAINDAEVTNSSSSKVEENWRTETASTNAQDGR